MNHRKYLCLFGVAAGSLLIGCPAAFAQEQTTRQACQETRKVLEGLEKELAPLEADEHAGFFASLDLQLLVRWRNERMANPFPPLPSSYQVQRMKDAADKVGMPFPETLLQLPNAGTLLIRLEDDLFEALRKRIREVNARPKADTDAAALKLDRLRFQRDLRKQRLRDLNCDNLSPDVADGAGWAGTYSDGQNTYVVSGSGSGITAIGTSKDGRSTGNWFGCSVSGREARCDFSGTYRDPDKSGTYTGRAVLTLGDGAISGTNIMDQVQVNWISTPYSQHMNVGAGFPFRLVRQK